MTREDVFKTAFETVTIGDVTTSHAPVLFTSCCKREAEAFVAENADHALIHSTPAGAALERLDLFAHMPAKLAYLHWFYLSSRFVIENTFTEEVLFIGNPNNPSSTAFGIEIPLVFHAKPNVMRLKNPLQPVPVTPRADWLSQKLMRPYVLSLLNLYQAGPGAEMNADEDVLFKKFNESADGMPTTNDALEARTEIGLKIMLSGYLSALGGFKATENPFEMRLT